jgi:hypothetical protein
VTKISVFSEGNAGTREENEKAQGRRRGQRRAAGNQLAWSGRSGSSDLRCLRTDGFRIQRIQVSSSSSCMKWRFKVAHALSLRRNKLSCLLCHLLLGTLLVPFHCKTVRFPGRFSPCLPKPSIDTFYFILHLSISFPCPADALSYFLSPCHSRSPKI